jgi:hypothetical protein
MVHLPMNYRAFGITLPELQRPFRVWGQISVTSMPICRQLKP